MKIGMEDDPIEALDREEERVIAAELQARFNGGDVRIAHQQFDRIASHRIELGRNVTALCG